MGHNSDKVYTFFIAGCYGFGNLGDELILNQIISDLIDIFKELNIVVWTNSLEHKTLIEANSITFVHRQSINDLINYVSKADCIIVGGGGLIQQHDDINISLFFDYKKPNITHYAYPAFVGKYYNKPVFYWSQGIGPIFDLNGIRFLKFFFSLCDYATVRDIRSLLLVKHLTPYGKKVELDIDPVIGMDLSRFFKVKTRIRSNDFINIGINIRSFYGIEHDIIDKIALTIKYINEKLPNKFKITLIPFNATYEDIAPLKKLKYRLKRYNIALDDELIMNSKTIYLNNVVDKMAQLNCFIGMRLHSIIVSAKLCIPTLAFAYDDKVVDFCKMYNVSFIDIRNIINLSEGLETLTIGNLLLNILNGRNHISYIDERRVYYKTPHIFLRFIREFYDDKKNSA